MSSNMLQLCDVSMKVALYPAETVDSLMAVQNHMNKQLLQYNQRLGGIPICYQDIAFAANQEYGHFFYEHPLVHVDITGKMLVFRPANGEQAVGRIVKISEHNVAIIVLGLFNASISGADMKKQFAYNASSREWRSKNDDRIWKEGDIVTFTMQHFQHSSGVLNISGAPSV